MMKVLLAACVGLAASLPQRPEFENTLNDMQNTLNATAGNVEKKAEMCSSCVNWRRTGLDPYTGVDSCLGDGGSSSSSCSCYNGGRTPRNGNTVTCSATPGICWNCKIASSGWHDGGYGDNHIWAYDRDCYTCGLEWDGSLDSRGERNAKWQCHVGGRKYEMSADPIWMENNRIYTWDGSKKCGLEWDGSKDSRGERNAKWDCSGSADPVFIENNKIYAYDWDDNKCGLEWDGSKSMENDPKYDGYYYYERNAKWDCKGNADKVGSFYELAASTCKYVRHSRTHYPARATAK